MSLVTIETFDRIAEITVNRPDKLNALNDEVLDVLAETVMEAEEDETVGALILTGAGEKAFVAGADIAELARMNAVTALDVSAKGQGLMEVIEACGKPVVAAVNGYAFGGGLELALACHLRVFSEKAKVGLPEVGLGLIPGYGGTQRLPRIVGRGRALEMILTGDPIDAATAHSWGLANRLAEPGSTVSVAQELATAILSKGPLAVRFALEAVLRGECAGPAEGLEAERHLFGLAAATEDMQEGLGAFLEKREADFQGR
ncbi:MAG: enoyl-CoA hydratase/isomerase family protein [Planctomycetota bacterium]|jgi:enoyl-CoA hydratase